MGRVPSIHVSKMVTWDLSYIPYVFDERYFKYYFMLKGLIPHYFSYMYAMNEVIGLVQDF